MSLLPAHLLVRVIPVSCAKVMGKEKRGCGRGRGEKMKGREGGHLGLSRRPLPASLPPLSSSFLPSLVFRIPFFSVITLLYLINFPLHFLSTFVGVSSSLPFQRFYSLSFSVSFTSFLLTFIFLSFSFPLLSQVSVFFPSFPLIIFLPCLSLLVLFIFFSFLSVLSSYTFFP